MSTDKNYESHWGEKNLVITGRTIFPENPTQYSDILKFSICENVLVHDCEVVGGKEDAIDVVRGTDYRFMDLRLHPKGRNGVTIKGGVIGAGFDNVLFETHGKDCDIELGQHTIYSDMLGLKDRTKRVHLTNVRAADGRPVVVKVWNADKPGVTGGNVKIKVVPTLIVRAYFLFRWIQRRVFKQD